MNAFTGKAVCDRAPKKCRHILNQKGHLVVRPGFSMSFTYPSRDEYRGREYIQSTPVVFSWRHGDAIYVLTRSGSRYKFSVA